jgi:hypothetical protein
MAIRANAAEENFNATHSRDLGLVRVTLGLEVGRVSVEKVHIAGLRKRGRVKVRRCPSVI